MKKQVLLLAAAALTQMSVAQQRNDHAPARYDLSKHYRMASESVVGHGSARAGMQTGRPISVPGAGGSRAVNSTPIGKAGNLFTALESGCNQIYTIDSLGVVAFVHRYDASLTVATNIGQYSYDISRDRGQTWTSNIGPFTAIPDNIAVGGRYPQAALHNPSGSSNPDSAYLVYSGAWIDYSAGASSGPDAWEGQLRGVLQLSGDPGTITENNATVNSGNVNIAASFTTGAAGEFWNIDRNYVVTSLGGGGDKLATEGFVVMKGVWNNTTKDVDWTSQNLSANFMLNLSGTDSFSVVTSFRIGFDPSGQNGWIFGTGDLTDDGEYVYSPFYYRTTNGGASWQGPFQIDLKGIEAVMFHLPKEFANGDPTSGLPTTVGDIDLIVDANGKPHVMMLIANGNSDLSDPANAYTFFPGAGMHMYDLSWDPNALTGCEFKASLLSTVNTYSAEYSNSDNQGLTEANRPQMSSSPDRTKLFFLWNDTDASVLTSSIDNFAPNLLGIGYDVTNNLYTNVKNFTEGDALWGGETANSAAGTYLGAMYPIVSPNCFVNGSTFNIPVVLTQIDYNLVPSPGVLPDAGNPCQFYYINNINFTASEFNVSIGDVYPPTISLNGADTIIIQANNPYNDPGATAFDCTDGDLTGSIQVQGSVTVNTPGVYTVSYICTDAAGNSDTTSRIVIVGAAPTANFTYTAVLPYRYNFVDQSVMFPAGTRQWAFGDGSGSIAPNPTKTYAANGTYNVCLTVTNQFGSDQKCESVTATQVGINDPGLSKLINVFPNPAKDVLNIEFNGVKGKLSIQLVNMLGSVVRQISIEDASAQNVQSLSLSELQSGVYFVRISDSKSTAIKPISINK
jgi:PKD repeat protein